MLPAKTANTAVNTTGSHESVAWCTPLTGYEFTLCEGADSAKFLQGQLSCNLQKLSASHSLRGALCNLKGRVITDLHVIPDETGILLLTRHGMRDKMLATLNKYRVFFKTTLLPLDDQLLVVGLGGTNLSTVASSLGIRLPQGTDEVITHSGLRLIALPPSQLSQSVRYLCVAEISNPSAQTALQTMMSELDSAPETLWQLADIRDGIAHIKPSQSELFTPQLLNYDINGVIDFKKGCYTGQEIVARMHYRAEAKRRLYHVCTTSLSAYESITDNNDVELVDTLQLGDGSVESLLIINEKSLQAVASQASLTSFLTTHSL